MSARIGCQISCLSASILPVSLTQRPWHRILKTTAPVARYIAQKFQLESEVQVPLIVVILCHLVTCPGFYLPTFLQTPVCQPTSSAWWS